MGIVALVLLAYSPALLTLRLIARYGVDLPYADEWAFVPLYLKAHQHSLTFADFFIQHNEHRYLFPKLLLLLIAPLSSGNTRSIMFLSFSLVLLTSGGLWHLLNRTVQTSIEKKLLLLGLLNLVLFGPVQAENWTWGFQFVLFFINLLLVAGISVAVSQRSIPSKFLICCALAFIATFSFGGGVMLWALTFPLALVFERTSGKKHLWLVAWLCAFGVVLSCYFYDYSKPIHHPPLAASHSPVDYLLYITTFLGNHLSQAEPSRSIVVASALGMLLGILYCSGVFWMIHSADLVRKRQMLPWLGLGACALLNAGVAAITRIGFGINQALDSRYTTLSLSISSCVIGLFAVVLAGVRSEQHLTVNRVNGMRWLSIACLSLFLASHIYASAWGIGTIKGIYRSRLQGKAALLFSNVLDAGSIYSQYLVGEPTQMHESANVANSLGFLHPRLFESPELSQFGHRPQWGGFFNEITLHDESRQAWGWAMIPKAFRQADAVLLTYDDPTKGPIAFAIVAPMSPRSDVLRVTQDPRLEHSGWLVNFSRKKVPPGDHLITAWAFDAEKLLVYPLATPQMLY
jgi:hypothetical protein